MTAKVFFERLYFVPGLRQFAPFVTMPSAPTSLPLALRLFLDFRAITFPSGPSFFFVSTIRRVIWLSPGTPPLDFASILQKTREHGTIVTSFREIASVASGLGRP